MSVSELKLQIINKISAIDDELILEEIFKLVDIESHMDSLYRVTDEERKAVTSASRTSKQAGLIHPRSRTR